jgi:hypothetical protein
MPDTLRHLSLSKTLVPRLCVRLHTQVGQSKRERVNLATVHLCLSEQGFWSATRRWQSTVYMVPPRRTIRMRMQYPVTM